MLKKLIIATTIASMSSASVAYACTSIAWKTDVGTLTTRTNDWSEPTSPSLTTIKKGSTRYTHGVKGHGTTYQTKYDILAITAYGMGLVHDGVNSEGMQMNVLYYGPMTLKDAGSETLSQLSLGEYLIANYATVEEVVENIASLKIEMATLDLPSAPKFHWSLTDKLSDRLVIEYDETGLSLYRGEEANVMTNQPSQQSHINAWNSSLKNIVKASSTVDFGSQGNTSPRDRFLHASYFNKQLKQPSSSINGMMKLATTVYRIPHDAANREINGVMAGYATEWSLTQNLNTGEAVWEYLWGDSWTNVKFNFYDILNSGKDISFNMHSPDLAGDMTQQIIESGK